MASLLDRLLARRHPLLVAADRIVTEVAGHEEKMAALTDEALKALTDSFKEELKNGATVESLVPRAFAAVREAAKRTLNERHYDVQIIGGYVLHRGAIAEMRTGEGKTLVATLPAYVNALPGKGVHVVTVNYYLA